MKLNTINKIKKFLKENSVDVEDVICTFENYTISKQIKNYPYTFFDEAMKCINSKIKGYPDEWGDDTISFDDKINNTINDYNGRKKRLDEDLIMNLNYIYDCMNENNELYKKEIEYNNKLKKMLENQKKK